MKPFTSIVPCWDCIAPPIELMSQTASFLPVPLARRYQRRVVQFDSREAREADCCSAQKRVVLGFFLCGPLGVRLQGLGLRGVVSEDRGIAYRSMISALRNRIFKSHKLKQQLEVTPFITRVLNKGTHRKALIYFLSFSRKLSTKRGSAWQLISFPS